MVWHTALEAWQRVTHYLHLSYVAGRIFFPGSTPHNDTVDSKFVVGIKPGDSGVVVGYQVNLFTTPDWQRTSLLNHRFILVSWVMYAH